MKITIVSDLHLECYSENHDPPSFGRGEMLILAGDILRAKDLKNKGKLNSFYRTFLKECSDNFEKILYVMGNHERYSYNWKSAPIKIEEALPKNFKLLENDTVKIGDWNFIGFTFWSDFRNGNPLDMLEASVQLNDYRQIRIGNNYRKLRPEDTYRTNLQSRQYLKDKLELLTDNIFVISHHSPSYRSVPPKFKFSSVNSAYCNDMDEFIINHPQIKYWVHGHTHLAQDYFIEQCRVICNPGGYPDEKTGFVSNFELEI